MPHNRGMPLLSDRDRQVVQQHLAALQHDVTLLLFTQTFGGSESGTIARQIVDEIATLHDRITVEEANFVLDKDTLEKYGIDKSPAIVVLRDGEDTRIRFYGAPAGYEFMSLIEAIILAGGDDSGLSEESKALVAQVDQPMTIEVFVTPT